jgi:hypothetical protein
MPERTERNEKVVALNVTLTPVNQSDQSDQSDQPVSANYTTVGVAQGIGYLDFGFLEPSALGALARSAREGKEVPKSLNGRLAVRVALPLDVLQRLQEQLQQVLVGLRGRKGPEKGEPKGQA